MRGMRAGGAAVAVAMVVASGLVLGPQADAARAWVTPPPVVSAPSSVLGAAAGTASTDVAVGGLTASGGAAVGTGTAAAGVSAGAAGATVAAGLAIGTYGGQMVVRVLPSTWVTTSGSTWCDLQWLIDANASCAQTGLPAGQAPNSDIGNDPQGWAGGVQTVTSSRGAWTATAASGTGQGIRADVVATAGYGQPGNVALTLSGSGAGVPAGKYDQVMWTIYRRNANGSETSATSSVDHWYAGGPDVVKHTWSGDVGRVEVIDSYTNNVLATWYPVGHPSRPASPDPNPARWFVASWSCADGSVGNASSSTFHETDASFPAVPPATCAGAVATYQVQMVSSSGITTQIISWTAPDVVRDWGNTQAAKEGTATLNLWLTDAQTGARISCQDNPSLCADWWAETEQGTAAQSEYDCTYAGAEVALSECTVYAHAYDLGTYSDPRTGEPGSSPAPNPDPGAQDDGCPPPFSWTSVFNPWWYYKGAVCAMQQVFVPKAQLQTAQVTQAWNSSSLGQLGTVVGNLGAGFAAIGGGACGVITDSEPVPLLGWHLVVDTCAWPWSAAGPLKRIIGIAFLLGAVVIGVRTVLRIIRADVVVDGGEK